MSDAEQRHGKIYLGDGVYMDHDGFAIVLTTSDGRRDRDRIVLENEVLQVMLISLAKFFPHLKQCRGCGGTGFE